MERVKVDEVEIDKCPKCGGVWLDPGELELLLKRAKGSKNGLMRFFYHLAGHYEE
ncbi:MAG: zf-TFIIB domain-containing protein [Candidatus Eremiobacteraeota bacterium]|nr:zf-TFIIB domain-containing protein [Candidatus Eremiobacteraeota bacterium]